MNDTSKAAGIWLWLSQELAPDHHTVKFLKAETTMLEDAGFSVLHGTADIRGGSHGDGVTLWKALTRHNGIQWQVGGRGVFQSHGAFAAALMDVGSRLWK